MTSLAQLEEVPNAARTYSALEGDRFELSVPRKRHNKFDVTRPHAGNGVIPPEIVVPEGDSAW